MIYVSGIHALNLNCKLNTTGDWHQSALKWKDITFLDSEKSPFGEHGIEDGHEIPKQKGKFYAANHIRACLDLISLGHFDVAQGMREDFICNEAYTEEIFNHVAMLKGTPNWNEIKNFKNKEYGSTWRNWIEPKEALK